MLCALAGGSMAEGHREKLLDQALADTFPASDPVSVAQPGGGPDSGAPRRDAPAQSQQTSRMRLPDKPRS
jgi:hypothetical protein